MDEDSALDARLEMVRTQIERRDLRSPRLLEVLRAVPRHRFVPLKSQELAYSDMPLSIGFGQTISQPYIVALMTHLADLRGDETVLEVGTGSGYQAAVLAGLCQWVHTIERVPQLAERARGLLAELNVSNVEVHCGDGSSGWPQAAPYQAILVTAAAPQPPQALIAQLAQGGRLVLPVGGLGGQSLQVWQRSGAGVTREDSVGVFFVPLRGEFGWDEADWPEYRPD